MFFFCYLQNVRTGNCQKRHPKTLQSKVELTQIDILGHKPEFDFLQAWTQILTQKIINMYVPLHKSQQYFTYTSRHNYLCY